TSRNSARVSFLSAETPRTAIPKLYWRRAERLASKSRSECINCSLLSRKLSGNLRENMTAELKIRLLVVDDEQSIRRLCMTIGTTLGFACAEAESAEAAVARLDAEAPDLVLTDLKLPNQSGVELLRQVKALLPRTEIAIMTGHGSIESAVDAM